MPETTFPPRITVTAHSVDKELVDTLREMIRDGETISAAAALRRMASVTQVSSLTRDVWRVAQLAQYKAVQLAEYKAAQACVEMPVEQLPPGADFSRGELCFRGFSYFMSIVRTCNFGRAARMLDIDQPVLSHHIRNLESGLGTQLFVRHSRGVTLTDAGRSLLSLLNAPRGGPVVQTRLGQDVRSDASRLSLAVPLEIGMLVLPQAIKELQRGYPNCLVSIKEGSSASLEEWIVNDKVDVAILHDASKFDAVKVNPIFTEDVGLLTSPSLVSRPIGRPVTLPELSRLPLILPSQRCGMRRKLDDVAFRHGLQLRVILEVDNISLTKALVKTGIASTILPLLAARDETSRGALEFQPIDRPQLTTTYAIAVSRSANSPLVSTLVGLLEEIIRSNVQSGRWPGARLVASAGAREPTENV